MISASELNDLGKQLASSYVNQGTSLTEGLQKVAQRKDLTNNQIDRVAEVANVETYLQLMKTAEDPYIQFDIADPKSVKGEESQSKQASSSASDYEKAPDYEFDMENYFGDNFQQEEQIDKAANLKHAQRIEGTIEYLDNRLMETAASYEQSISKLAYAVKQAHLQGQPIEDLYDVIKQAADISSEQFWPIIETKLSNSRIEIPEDLEKTARPADSTSSIYKQAERAESELYKLAQINYALQEYIDQYKESVLYNGHVTDPMEKSAGVIKDSLNFINEHRGLTGAAVLAGAAYAAGKSKGLTEQGQVLQEELVNVKGNNRR